MKRMLQVLLLYCMVGLCACGHKHNNNALLSSQIESTFQQAVNMMISGNKKLHAELEKKSHDISDPCYSIEAMRGLVYSDTLKLACDQLLQKIKELEDVLKANGSSSHNVDGFFGKQGKANELQASIQVYKNIILKIDTTTTKELGQTINSFPEEIIYEGIDLDDGLIQLKNLTTRVYLLQNSMMHFWMMRCSGCCLGATNYPEAIVMQDAVVVPADGQIVITAGVATFESRALASVSINGKHVETVSGKAVHQMKVPGVPGEYTVPVNILYKHQRTGEMVAVTKKVHYTVTKKVE